ncbi:MAG: DEAD/DEAH box helicase family protein, partial [Caldilineaceae bacterium]|nr:DEAD/DEAH box helicase family protein [Caldilineaceae bacterium]
MILRPYQRAAIDCTWQWMRQHDGNPAIVLPTGAGKSPVMGALAQEACQQWGARVAILAHTKELVSQNAEKLAQVWPEADLGTYSASLKRRDRFNQVLSCQIQSVAKKAGQLGRFNLILIDEAHRIPLKGEGLYLQFIAECRRFNPDLRVIGLTATPYRLQGAAVPVCGPNYILNEISYESRIGDLIADGYLSALVSKGGRARADLSEVHIRGGEYIESELARAVDRKELVSAACDEIVDLACDRKALIVFCVSVDHAEHVQTALQQRGVTTGLVHGKTPAAERDATIADYQAGKLRAL